VPHYSPCQRRTPTRAASWCVCMAWGTGAPRVVAKEPRRRDGAMFVWAPVSSFRPSRAVLTSVGDGKYSCERASCQRRGGDSSCGTEICRARRRLLVRDENLSCEAETLRAGRKHVGEATPPSWSLVGEASYCPETRHLASNGLDKDPQSSLY
jgi:hypothetical protein